VKLSHRRQFLHLAAGAVALPVLLPVARAQTYPTHPVRLIVGFPAGNASDIYARLIAQSLSERLGQQFVVENRPGAGGNVGTEFVVRALPDGYTSLLVLSSNANNATLYANLNFNFIRDIAPVASVVDAPYAMVLNPSVERQQTIATGHQDDTGARLARRLIEAHGRRLDDECRIDGHRLGVGGTGGGRGGAEDECGTRS
jgi:tripartite-type tricarboxylate transporter receptor subunit TctC